MSELEQLLEEDEHQAFDLLDALAADALGPRPWTEPDPAPLAREGETPASFAAATQHARAALIRSLALVARGLIDAARPLAASGYALALEPAQLEAAAQQLDARPELAAALAPALETTELSLGLAPGTLAHALLARLSSEARADLPPSLPALDAALSAALRDAWPTVDNADEAPKDRPQAVHEAQRVFRSASVAMASPPIRARALAAEQPAQLALAERLVAHERDPATLVETFERALAELEAAAAKAPIEAPKDSGAAPAMDGPKRPFTMIHVVLALIVLGLTLWHYVWR